MGLFNKGSASRSRQSSVDSNISVTDSWIGPPPGTSPFGDPPPPSDRREKTPHGRRTSVFTLRSRSNTATSTTSSFLSRASTMTGTEESYNGSSHGTNSLSSSQLSLSTMSSQKQRSFFASQGRKLRRQSSRLGSTSDLDEVYEMDGPKRNSVLKKGYRRGTSEDTSSLRKKHISNPFDFQHLTHSHPQHFATLDRASENELVADFWAVRASQMPKRELTGIKADDLHFKNFSSEALNKVDSNGDGSSSIGIASPPMLSPTRSREILSGQSPSPQASNRSLRHSRSVESFSQPKVKSRSSVIVTPPPRTSSRLALGGADGTSPIGNEWAYGLSNSPYSSNRSLGMWERPFANRPSTADSIATLTMDANFVPHAMTTPDDSAIPATSPGFGTELENVPEEPEYYFQHRVSQQFIGTAGVVDSGNYPHPQGILTDATQQCSRHSLARPKSPKPRPLSQMSDTLGAAFVPPVPPPKNPRRNMSVRRQSSSSRYLDSSWEDDIDYCYEHAAEADCDFEWDRESHREYQNEDSRMNSFDTERGLGVSENQDRPIESRRRSGSENLQTDFYSGAFRPSLLVPSTYAVPDLDHRSALSASTTSAGAITPSDVFASPKFLPASETTFNETESFNLTPSLLIPQDFKFHAVKEVSYEELLADYDGSDRHYPFLDATEDGGISIAESSRSSRTRLSKRSSYDSSLRSGAGSLTSLVRRSASSSGSLPELVHSRRARRTYDIMVDHLTEQVASFANLGEESDNETASRSASQPEIRQTFFKEETDKTYLHSVVREFEGDAIEEEGSSETTPTGIAPQRHAEESRPHHHERAASDSAAKMLAGFSQPKSVSQPRRKRASSSVSQRRGSKAPYTLSLFPAPKPRNASPQF